MLRLLLMAFQARYYAKQAALDRMRRRHQREDDDRYRDEDDGLIPRETREEWEDRKQRQRVEASREAERAGDKAMWTSLTVSGVMLLVVLLVCGGILTVGMMKSSTARRQAQQNRPNGNLPGAPPPPNPALNAAQPIIQPDPVRQIPIRAVPANPPNGPQPPKAEVPFDENLWPLDDTDAIREAPLTKDREVRKLPFPVKECCIGGGGQFLMLHMPGLQKLAIFDVNEAKIVKYLDVPEGKLLITAGRDFLIVADPEGKTVERYALPAFEKEATTPLPGSGTISVLTMGSASRGPLFVARTSGSMCLDPATFKVVDLKWIVSGPSGFPPWLLVRASANGRLFTAWAPSGSPTGFHSFRLEGDKGVIVYRHESPGPLLPSANGKVVFGPNQAYTPAGLRSGESLGNSGQVTWFVPAVQGDTYLTVRPMKDPGKLQLYLNAPDRNAIPLPQIDDLSDLLQLQSGHTLILDHNLFLIPQGKLLVLLPPSADKLILYRLDVEKAFDVNK